MGRSLAPPPEEARKADVAGDKTSGFTLIELSIVLVIIGLIVGGVLAGQHLISAAAVRSQISQINSYNAAVYVFEGKYGGLPGDIPDPAASQYGLQARGQYAGQGDGNGIIEGNCANSAGANSGFTTGCGEIPVFFEDLTAAGLTDTSIVPVQGAGGVWYPSTWAGTWLAGDSAVATFFPHGKLAPNLFIYVFSYNSTNYFGLSTIDAVAWTSGTTVGPGITVQQAYAIDSKMDDGMPQSGSVTACYVNYNVVGYQAVWAAGASGGTANQGANGNSGPGYNCVPTVAATAYAPTNCYDNSNVTGPQRYSVANNANLPNCALSFRFQ